MAEDTAAVDSDRDVCAASPLILPSRTASIAVAVPAADRRHLLRRAAATIENRSTTMALSLTLALNTTRPTQAQHTARKP
ncbi:hypothetical protein ACGFX2_38620 [Streptomyces goshikiensis]|uniref:hypothetical protein n=1 Tax=Streptomyces goshikiensis TaxID=1942 RepID=UPI0037147476